VVRAGHPFNFFFFFVTFNLNIYIYITVWILFTFQLIKKKIEIFNFDGLTQ
jgi:hypothetical protein